MWKGITYLGRISWQYNRNYIIYLFGNQMAKIILSFLTLFFPQIILDLIFTSRKTDSALFCMSLFLILTVIFSSLGQLLTQLSNNARTETFNLFQIDLAKKMMSTKLENIESESFLSLKAKAEQYLYAGGQGFANVLENSFDILGMFVSLIMYSVIIVQLHWLVLLSLVIIIIVNVLFNYHYQKKNIKINIEKAVQERKTAYYTSIFQDYSYGKEIRVNDLRGWLLNKYQLQLYTMKRFYQSLNQNNFLYGVFSIIITTIQQGISYIYLLVEITTKGMSVGSFSLYLNAISSFSSNIKSLLNQIITIRQYTIYYEAFEKYINTEDIFSNTHDNILKLPSDNICIEFKNVSFKYPHSSQYALYNINAVINKGDKIAIVGHNGAGKSTFIKLLLRIYEPTDGEITINGMNINSISYSNYLSLFSTVFQDYKLFAQSILENITFQQEMYKINNVYDILNYLGIENKINELESGINTQIYKLFDDDGYIPSEGEAQKIAFARALYKNAAIMILDEPSSSLDPQAEFEMYELFSKIADEKTCIFISHRLAISKFCNNILVFSKGTLIEKGNHHELMKRNNLYAKLYNMQIKFYENGRKSKQNTEC